MMSIKRLVLLLRRPRLFKGILQRFTTWACVSICLFVFFIITIYSKNDSSEVHLNKIPVTDDSAKESIANLKEEEDVTDNVSKTNKIDPDIHNADFEDEIIRSNNLFGNLKFGPNTGQDTISGKLLSFADKVMSGQSSDGESTVKKITRLAQSWRSLSEKFENVRTKLENLKLNDAQRLVESDEKNSLTNSEQYPSGLHSIPGTPPNLPIEEQSKERSSFPNILTKVAPMILSGMSSDPNDGNSRSHGDLLSLLIPQAGNGDKKNAGTALGSLVGVIGGLTPLLKSAQEGKTISILDTLAMLKPVVDAIGPSIMNRFVNTDTRKYVVEDPFAGGLSLNDDKVSNSSDGKNVGQAVGRVLRSVMVNSLPESVRLPSPSSIRSPYDMALNLIIGNPKKNTEGWKWVRKVAGVNETSDQKLKWIQKAFEQSDRLSHKESIRQFYELITKFDENCENVQSVGGVYDWKRDRILESRIICKDGSLWDSSPQYVLSFGSQLGWSFEEEMAKEEDMKVYIVSENIPEEESILKYFTRGKLIPSGEKKSGLANDYSEWLKTLRLQDKRLNLVKIDQEDGLEILTSLVHFNERNFEFIEQLSINVDLENAIKNPRLYSQYVSTIETLKTYGFHIFNVTAYSLVSYKDPLFDDTELFSKYQISFIRI